MTEAKKVRATKTPQPDEEQDAPLLSISSLSKRTEHIDIDGDDFFFVNLDAVGIRERQTIFDLLTETFNLGGKSVDKRLTKAEAARYDTKLRELTLLILPTMTKKRMGTGKPDEGLGTGHLSDIAVAFFVSAGESVPDRIELTKRMEKLARSLSTQTGARSSRVSRRSTRRQRRGG